MTPYSEQGSDSAGRPHRGAFVVRARVRLGARWFPQVRQARMRAMVRA
jgi:hypothetical protein